MYDDAGDSLLHVLPGRWAGREPAAERWRPRRRRSCPGSIDFEFNTLPTRIAERYALIVSYHYCHPSGGWLKGTKSITPEEFDAQLRVLTQNFVCTTMGELMNPAADLPETVAVVTFDDGFKDVVEHALPLLQRWRVPATVYCCSAPLLERTRAQRASRPPAAGEAGARSIPRGVRGAAGVAAAGGHRAAARIPGCSASTRTTTSRRGDSSGC